MGVIRWTAKGLKLTGELLDSDNVEAWIETKGKQLLEQKLKQLPAKWFAGQLRARRWLQKDLQESVEASPAFQSALEETLSQLPTILLTTAQKLSNSASSQLSVKTGLDFYIVVCPRGVVRRSYSEHVVSSLKDAASLARYTGFPEMFLEGAASTSEESYFSDKKRPPELGQRGKVLDTDGEFPWGLLQQNGHYYVGMTSNLSSTNLSDKQTSKRFDEFCSKNLDLLKIRVGKLTSQDVDQLRTQLQSLFNVS
jgi:hypothetical protein